MHNILDGNPELKKGYLGNEGFAEKMFFSWILKNAVGRPGLEKYCLKIKSSGGASVNMIVKFVLNKMLIIFICSR
jgi:hypothetical protein